MWDNRSAEDPVQSQSPDGLLTRLSAAPVLGISMANVSILRLDRIDSLAPGNKLFKLEGILSESLPRRSPLRGRFWLSDKSRSPSERAPTVSRPHNDDNHRLVSFGGPWSNHLHALAALGREHGIETVGVIRGEAGPTESAALADMARWGMRLVNVTRTDYRRRNDPDYLASLREQFAPCVIVPEGGASPAGVRGCTRIATMIRPLLAPSSRVVLAVGTGTTLAGIAAGLDSKCEIVGVSALRGAWDLDERVREALAGTGTDSPASWNILHEDHCGGFARVSEELKAFILDFERVHGIPLDPVYTGKMLFAIHQRLRSGEWSTDKPVLAVHTGGLQGRRGFDFLD
jgi:1-aminocyclopropane-1-carboxylate deaminase